MITESQKQHVRKMVEKILAQIDWPPEKLCELAIRAALAVSKSPEGAEFRKWAEKFIEKGFEEFHYMKRNALYIGVKGSYDDHEERALWGALSTTYDIEYGRTIDDINDNLSDTLFHAKLTAKLRGENLEISEIIKEMKIKEEV